LLRDIFEVVILIKGATGFREKGANINHRHTATVLAGAAAGTLAFAVLLLHLPSKVYMSMNMTMVERHPPPNFLAPQPAIIVLKKLFMIWYLSFNTPKR
jgi:hypothetical protein